MRLRLITLPILLAAAALLPASAQARTHVAVGLGDQSAALYSNIFSVKVDLGVFR